ncbi:MAG: hypothetical protein VYC34_06210 [Planctomycetota bacterium]|nr:hypothetical protein [Planctomycetota bacterium]
MGMLSRLTSVFARTREDGAGGSVDAEARERGPLPRSPVGIEYDELDEGARTSSGGSRFGLLSRHRGGAPEEAARQQSITELKENYNEVMDLVRKVNAHLDRQEARSSRMIEIAERIPEGIDALGDIRAQGETLIEVARSTHAATEAGTERVTAALDRSIEAELKLVEEMSHVRTTMDDVAGSNAKIGETLQSMHRSSTAREGELIGLISESRRWMQMTLIGCAAGVGIALIVAIVALVA